ncbi:protein FAM234A [Chrysoperla carnea]|uniref:protein FAM234A n=1 Tax=Chrysoperla carnea TaxID=189513 RepID=UPI001D068BFE|nr:protein FAM234A [Chrysoperla carnea]
MTGGGNTAQGVYTPLPQTISDTESEEDIHTTIQITKLPANPHNHLNGGKETMRNYYPLDEGDNGFPNIHLQDDVPIIKDGGKTTNRMSPLRQFLFVSSILLCFLTIFIFVWVLPCDEDLTCPSVIRNEYTSNWEQTYHGIELKNVISVVSGVSGRSRNLVFLFRDDIRNIDQKNTDRRGGLVSIVGSSGKVAWFTNLNRVPTDIDCNLIDIDNNGENDCIIIGENGLMEAVNPITGTVTWHLHSSTNGSLYFTSVDFPLVLPDIDNDGVFDLVTSSSLNKKNHNNLILISGKTGNLIGEPLTVAECKTIHEIAIDKDRLLSYTCENITFKLSAISLEQLYRKITKKNLISPKIDPSKQHTNQRNVYSIHNRKLIVKNEGQCPGNCNVTVQLIDLQSGKENLTWSHTGTNMYGMVPATLVFNDTDANREALKGHISGFILKFWQWNEPGKYKNEKLSVTNHSRKLNKNVLDDFIISKRNSYSSSNIRTKRNIPNLKKNNSNMSVLLLTERVVLITFNSTDLHIVNASQNEITQLCKNHRIVECQPDLNFQENSVLIADLDQDGSQELISYLSTYVVVDHNDKDYSETTADIKWELQSIVKVVRLEAELPKLYEAVSKY